MRDFFSEPSFLYAVDGDISSIDWEKVPKSGGVKPGDVISGGVWASILSRYAQLWAMLDDRPGFTATYSREIRRADALEVLTFANSRLYANGALRRFVWAFPAAESGSVVELGEIADPDVIAQAMVAPQNPTDDRPWEIKDDLTVVRAATMNALQELFTAPPGDTFFLHSPADSAWSWKCSAFVTVERTPTGGETSVEQYDEPESDDLCVYYRDRYLTTAAETVTSKMYHWSEVKFREPSSFAGMFGHLDYNGQRNAFLIRAEKTAHFVAGGSSKDVTRWKYFILHARQDRGLNDEGLSIFARDFSDLINSVADPDETLDGYEFTGRTDRVRVGNLIHGAVEYAVSM